MKIQTDLVQTIPTITLILLKSVSRRVGMKIDALRGLTFGLEFRVGVRVVG